MTEKQVFFFFSLFLSFFAVVIGVKMYVDIPFKIHVLPNSIIPLSPFYLFAALLKVLQVIYSRKYLTKNEVKWSCLMSHFIICLHQYILSDIDFCKNEN